MGLHSLAAVGVDLHILAAEGVALHILAVGVDILERVVYNYFLAVVVLYPKILGISACQNNTLSMKGGDLRLWPFDFCFQSHLLCK